MYSLYRDQYAFPESLLAVLFVTGFVSAGLSAPLVGVWADQQCVIHHASLFSQQTYFFYSGRRKLCLVFCMTYTLACICITIPSLPTLLFGRILGGISTSILFSAFESWLISASSSAGLPPADLSTIMGRATLINGLVATGAGVISNKLVESTNNFIAPFIASATLLVLAWFVIGSTWSENYGTGGGIADHDILQISRLGKAWNIVRQRMFLTEEIIKSFGISKSFVVQILFCLYWVLRKHVSRDPCTYSSSCGSHPSKNAKIQDPFHYLSGIFSHHS